MFLPFLLVFSLGGVLGLGVSFSFRVREFFGSVSHRVGPLVEELLGREG